MPALTPLHDDHQLLRPALEALRAAADIAGAATVAQLRSAVAAIGVSLRAELLPHLAAEEEVLYPTLRRVMRSGSATAGMEHDHAQIRRMASRIAILEGELDEVDEVDDRLARELYRTLYGLHALLDNHLDKEESIYHPLLERSLTPDQRRGLVTSLDSSAARHRLHATS